MTSKQSGQALVFGLPMLLLVLLFCGYFLFASECYFRLFRNAEKANMDELIEISSYANILNEISINNQNILSSLATVHRGLLASLESGLYVGFHQPYWDTYGSSIDSASNRFSLSSTSKNFIKKSFALYSLQTSRGFFMARALASRNSQLIDNLPNELQSYFKTSTNAQAQCFALQAQKNLYSSPGIIDIFVPHRFVFQFYLHLSKDNGCVLEHKGNSLTGFLQKKLPNFLLDKDNTLFNFQKIDRYSSFETNYGITYIDPKFKKYFLESLKFQSKNNINENDKVFTKIYKYFSKIPYFDLLKKEKIENLKKNILINDFILTNKFLFCEKNSTCETQDNDFLKSFFSPTWSVVGIYKPHYLSTDQGN